MNPSQRQSRRSKRPLPTLFPLPSKPHSYFNLDSNLREDLVNLLFDNRTSIPAIQAALSDALDSAGWMPALREYALDVARREDNVTVTDLVERVLLGAREQLATAAAAEEEADEEDAGNDGKQLSNLASPPLPLLPKDAVHKGIVVVKRELEGLCELAADQD